jgi:hypothetical protein
MICNYWIILLENAQGIEGALLLNEENRWDLVAARQTQGREHGREQLTSLVFLEFPVEPRRAKRGDFSVGVSPLCFC